MTLLRRVADTTGLALPTTALEEAAAQTRTAISEQVQGSEEVARVVHALEEQYDAYVRGRSRTSLLASEDRALPSADELGAWQVLLHESTLFVPITTRVNFCAT